MEWQTRGGRGRGTTPVILEGEEFGCAFCKGAGVAAKTHSRCPVCSGQGSVRVEAPAALCTYCRGRGEVPARSGITCTVCRGKGVVPVRGSAGSCPACRGRGRAGGGQLPCTTCRGTGLVTLKSP